MDAAQAALVVADAGARSQIGQTRGYRFKLQHAIEDVDNQVALVFYKRQGYFLEKVVPHYYANGVDALILQKKLEKDLLSTAQAS